MAIQEEGCIIDNLLAEIRKGFCLKKTRAHVDRDTLPPAGRPEDSREPGQSGLNERPSASGADKMLTQVYTAFQIMQIGFKIHKHLPFLFFN